MPNPATLQKTAWIVSLPRSGSMWTFNLARRLASAAGLAVRPETVPQEDGQMLGAYLAAKQAPDPGTMLVLKTHILPEFADPHLFYINPRRDIRDALISFMRFMHYDFDRALGFARGAVAFERQIDAHPNARKLIFDYRNILERPEEVGGRICDFLGLAVPAAEIAAAVASLAKDKVAARIRSVETSIKQREQAGAPVDDRELVRDTGTGWERAFDVETGFQSGHVSDYRDGDWRKILTPEQQATLDEILGPSA